MSISKKVTLTITDRQSDLLDEWSKLSGRSKSQIIKELLEQEVLRHQQKQDRTKHD